MNPNVARRSLAAARRPIEAPSIAGRPGLPTLSLLQNAPHERKLLVREIGPKEGRKMLHVAPSRLNQN